MAAGRVVSSTGGAGFGQNGYLGDWAQTCSKDNTSGGCLSLIVTRGPGRLALPWAQWVGRIREHASTCGTTGKSSVVPSTGLCGHPTICQAHMGVQLFSCPAHSHKWSPRCQCPAPSVLLARACLFHLPGMPFLSLPTTRVNYDSSFGSQLKCHFQGSLPYLPRPDA